MTFNKYIVGGIVIILAILLGFLGGLYLKKPQVITNPVPVYIKGKVRAGSYIKSLSTIDLLKLHPY